jgi:hypothetical protein
VHYYDLRKLSQPLFIYKGHDKAVSYVRFLNGKEMVSAYVLREPPPPIAVGRGLALYLTCVAYISFVT